MSNIYWIFHIINKIDGHHFDLKADTIIEYNLILLVVESNKNYIYTIEEVTSDES